MIHQSNRREFLQRTALAATAIGAVGSTALRTRAEDALPAGGEGKKQAVLKISAQEGVVPGKGLSEKLDNMEKWGYVGLEVGGGNLPKRVKELQDALKGRPIKLSAICAGFQGWLISDDKETREKALSSMKEILTAAGELGSTGLIIVPAFNGQKSVPHKQAREMLTGFTRWDRSNDKARTSLLGELGEHAAKAGTRILLEPLNRDECYFLRTLADGASICRDVNSPGIALMGDFWHMTWEETCDMGAFLSAGKYLRHVHIASRKDRKTPGEDGEADNYINGFKGLKMIGYQDYISLECGCRGDRSEVIPAAAKLIREQWAKA
ncbi:MAG TPA: sugar phosphate isomerase/epimerase family protein [Phycisphaerae bacterium]|nr:sugar phosphate isomerase/epimerase family protein [Phycisphaerae bacterium]HRY70159.1 sugar phosphate isomerase/epimerase family protein [Phycisphaerae bacterium]HSA29680.1 sugar phosphate isomerase/epimerase family protein [Phycisphaerae bacterium]